MIDVAPAKPASGQGVLEVVILAPTGRDGPLTRRVLESAGFAALVCSTMDEVCAAIDDTTGVLLIAEEALHQAARETLLRTLDVQPSWSDVPIVVLTGEGELSRAIPRALVTVTTRGNATLLERPVRVATLVTTLRSALRARQHQLDVREHLLEQARAAAELRNSEASLRTAVESERRAREDAEQANRTKGMFLATMSHELRTPLNAIAGYAEILSMEIAGPVTSQQQKHLARIIESERHLLALINDVLNFAKIEAGHVLMSIAPVDMRELVAGLEAFVAPLLQSKQLRFEASSDSTCFALADEEKVRQIMLNLLSNAIKFTPEHGQITVRCVDGDAVVEVTVTDTGEGIAPDKLEEIFEPFVQVDTRLTRVHEGVGLGLAISRDLARGMGGELSVRSTVGQGSTFTLALPRGGSRAPRRVDQFVQGTALT